MKKLFALLVTVSILLSMAVIVPQAADIEGDWTTWREANDYNHPVDEVTGEESGYRPAPGYEYTGEGFSTVPADYTGTYPYLNVVTKEKQDVKAGIYIQFRIDEFSYKGESGEADEWIAVALWNQPNFTIHSDAFGQGYFQHYRGAGDGKATIGGQEFFPEVDDEGREIYTFEVVWDGTAYHFMFCGVEMANSLEKSQQLEAIDPSGEFYVGIALRSTESNGKASLTILEYGTSKADASKPVGTDEKEPEVNNNVTAPIADPATVPENMPAIYFDASTYPNFSASGMEMNALGNNGYRCKFTASGAAMMPWFVRKDVSYDIADFPVMAYLVKDFWNTTTIWYLFDDIYDAGALAKSVSVYDGIFFEDEENEEIEDYTLLVLDTRELDLKGRELSGRINGARFDIQGANPDADEFELCYIGWFRSVEEAEVYSRNYLGIDSSAADTDASGADETEAADNGEDTAGEDGTIAAEGTAAEAGTNAEAGTGAEAGTTAGTTATTEKGGCASVVGFGLTGLFALAALVVLKKKD